MVGVGLYEEELEEASFEFDGLSFCDVACFLLGAQFVEERFS